MEHFKKHQGAGRKFIDQGVIAMARDIAAAVDSAGLLPQAKEASRRYFPAYTTFLLGKRHPFPLQGKSGRPAH
jgi:hypothetical protein